MKLTTKGRFAVTAMLDIGIHEANGERKDTQIGPVTLADISERQRISLSYLEQLFSKLRRNGLVNSIRGPGGGYKLARPSHEISVAQIISAVDEQIDATQCGGHENCHGDDGPCMTHDLWASLNQRILGYLDGISLGEMVNAQLQQHPIVIEPKSDLLKSRKEKAASNLDRLRAIYN